MKNTKAVWGAMVVIAIIAIIGLRSPNNPEPVQKVVNTLGAASGFDFLSPFVNFDGVVHEYRRAKLNTATTTPCALKSPAATSSYLFTGVTITTATSTDTTIWTAARALSAFATTTQLGQASLTAATQGQIVVNASTTVAVSGAGILPPNSYIVWGVQGTQPGSTANLNGFCEAEFLVL